jgi:hypothetical protein
MKKTLIAIFSVSITAGTAYFGYLKFKEFTINKLVKTWVAAQANTLKSLNNDQQTKLKSELDKLSLWEIKPLVTLTFKIQNNASETEKAEIGKKLIGRKIFEKADLSDVAGFLEYKKYTT